MQSFETKSNRGDALSSFNLGSLRHGSHGDPGIPLDLAGSAEAYAKCVTQVSSIDVLSLSSRLPDHTP